MVAAGAEDTRRCRTKKEKEEAARSRQEEQGSKLEEEWEEPQ